MLRVKQDLREVLGQLGRLVRRVPPVLQEQLELRVKLDLQDQLVRLDRLVPQELLVQPDK